MQKKINTILWSTVFLLFIGGIGFFFWNRQQIKMQSKQFFYMNTPIYVKLYHSNTKKMEEAFQKLEQLYQEYHQLTDRYQAYDRIHNVYYILHNQEETDEILLDPHLYDLLKLSQEWGNQYPCFDIGLGNVLDIWKKYREQESGVPKVEELEAAGASDHDKLQLLPENKIKNNHPNLDLGGVAKGYATQKAGELLKELGITKFIINAGGNVLVGDEYGNGPYKIGIENPNQKGDVFTIIEGSHLSVVTSGGYERFYEYEGVRYHHIIDPKTRFPANYMKSVTVMTSDSTLADLLSTTLFLMPVDEGMELIEQLDDVEAIWFTNDDMIVRSSGVSSYEAS